MINVLFFASLAYIISCKIDPLEDLKFKYGFILEPTTKDKGIIKYLFIKVINCAPCLSFWLSLFFLGFQLSIITFIVTEGLVKLLSNPNTID